MKGMSIPKIKSDLTKTGLISAGPARNAIGVSVLRMPRQVYQAGIAGPRQSTSTPEFPLLGSFQTVSVTA